MEDDDVMRAGHVSPPNGVGVTYPDGEAATAVGVAPNSLAGGGRRDRCFGSPWHENVPARIEPLGTPPPGSPSVAVTAS